MSMPKGRRQPKVDPDRRSLLRFLLGSPLLLSPLPTVLQTLLTEGAGATSEATEELIQKARDAINVFDFESVARQALSPAHWTYLSMGVQHEVTLRANRSAFDPIQLRPRRLVDTRELDTSLELFGESLTSPVLLSPCGAQKAFHPEGELAVARAADRVGHVQILSTGSSTRIQEVAAEHSRPLWFQLYTPRLMPFTKLQIQEAEDAGCTVVVLTVDQVGLGRNRDRLRRFRRASNAECQSCHASAAENLADRVGRGLDLFGVDAEDMIRDFMTLDWSVVDEIRKATDLKLVIKGILTPEDAELSLAHGVDGIIVSNHGGRGEDNGFPTIEALPDIAAAVGGRMPILIDSGFRRGTDIFKALALGASAVCIGRPYLWGLAGFGQEGVEAVLKLLDRELRQLMVEMGTPSLSQINSSFVRSPNPRKEEPPPSSR